MCIIRITAAIRYKIKSGLINYTVKLLLLQARTQGARVLLLNTYSGTEMLIFSPSCQSINHRSSKAFEISSLLYALLNNFCENHS
jgi:hypothetical protein